MVVCPKPKIVLRKDADIANLKSLLGTKFPLLFEEQVQYRPRKEFQNLMSAMMVDGRLDTDNTQAVMAAVDMVLDTPRVSFKD